MNLGPWAVSDMWRVQPAAEKHMQWHANTELQNARGKMTEWKAPFGISYIPTSDQLSFHMDESKAKFAYGWMGSGKTHALLVEVAKRIESDKLREVLIVSRNHHQRSSLSEAYMGLFRHMTEVGKRDSLTTKFIGGECRITLSTAQADHRGLQYDLVALDECSIQLPRFKWMLISANPQNIPDREDLVRRYGMTKHNIGVPLSEELKMPSPLLGNWDLI